jgi:hypothetical protein
VTHDGSFPGRPRGRRARHDNDAPEWSGYDAAGQDQREFPDLSPVRPREARARDGYAQDERQGQQPQPGQPGQPGRQSGGQPGVGYLTDGAGYPAGTPGYPPVGPGGPGGGGQQWPHDQRTQGQQAVSQQAMNQQAMSQPAVSQPPLAQQPEEDIPDWAEPDSVEAFSARWHRRGMDSRGDRRSGRRKNRRLLFGAGGVAVLVVAAVVYFLIGGSSTSANLGFGSLVTTFLPGEMQSVPNACDTVPSSMLSEFLPGTLKQAAPPLNTGADTECTWTLDHSPTYRVLQVHLVAYAPSALYGNGSATVVAAQTYQAFEDNFVKPAAKSGQPSATVTDLSGMPGGKDTSAFVATQLFNRNGATTDVAHVLVRYRNVIVTVVVNGLDQASGAKKYGPVAMSDLTAAAQTVAKEVASKIVG